MLTVKAGIKTRKGKYYSVVTVFDGKYIVDGYEHKTGFDIKQNAIDFANNLAQIQIKRMESQA